jgi:hypothetical protein
MSDANTPPEDLPIEDVESAADSGAAKDDPNLNLSTIKEFQERFKVSHVTVWKWIKSGQLKIIRLGERIIRISKQAELDLIRDLDQE